MRKAYRITGSSFDKPENLPEGFTVKERLVGEVLGTNALVFHEVKDGSVVVYRQGVSGSNVKLDPEEVKEVMMFLNKVYNSYMQTPEFRKSLERKCPGTPHRGHSASDWSCWMDRG